MHNIEDMERLGTVAVVHFFSERTDGVSLQMHENDRVLSQRGWNVIECSADATGENSFVLPELDYSTPQVQIFKGSETSELQNETALENAFENQVQVIKNKLRELIRQYHPQVIHIRNILSLPIHPAATVAMAECIAEHPAIGFLTQHHDFSFEDDLLPGDRKKAYEIPFPSIQKRVEKALLYSAPQVHHAVINSLMQQRLLEGYGIHAAVIPDSFDFETRPTEIANLREKLGIRANDFVIGTMARIIPRKAIEVAVQLIADLQKRKKEFLGEGRGVYRRTITQDSRFLLLLPQSAGLDEPENSIYFTKLQRYAESLGVEICYAGDKIIADSAYRGGSARIPFYSLYHTVDLFMFPSYQEGFGNQFLEAVALGRGVVSCHAYPVMEADILPRISPEGVILLGRNRDYALDETGLIHLREDILQAAVERESYFLLHPDEEQQVAARTYQRLKEAFDAKVVGNQLAALLYNSVPLHSLFLHS
ncbi:MAG: glycosyltransferase family 4 protein [Ktedonobacteraceae bacterium]|nr:glycosyltransferase family 4 protein [Ktedonobacteraceae bacterium]